MTERLSALLRDGADQLEVPPVDLAVILGRGKQDRHRRRFATLLAAAMALVVVGIGATVAATSVGRADRGGQGTDSATGSRPSRGLVAYGADSTVVIGGTTATIPDILHSLHYTSVGVLTRSNPNDGASDGSGPERLTLITEDGSTTDLGTVPEGVGPATDPDEPVYALAERSGDGFVGVVRDALTGDEVASVPLPDLPMSYWPVPPLGLDGDVVYAGFEESAVAINWRTGETQSAAGVAGGIPQVHNGRAILQAEGTYAVVDAATGDAQLEIPLTRNDYAFGVLSPDGRFLRIKVESMTNGGATDGVEVYDIDTGKRVQLPGTSQEWGWSAGSSAFRVTGQGIEMCSAVTGACTSESAPNIGANLRLGGNIYES
jgi:hypothetical protein